MKHCDGAGPTRSTRSHALTKDWPQGQRPFGEKYDYSKLVLLGITYAAVVVAGHWLAFLIRFEFQSGPEQQALFWQTLRWILPVELGLLLVFGQFSSLLSYFSLPDARRIVFACAGSSLTSMSVWYLTQGAKAPPRSIIIISFLLDTGGVIGVRILLRMLRERQRGGAPLPAGPRRVAIIGAGDVGANLAKEMMLRRDLGMQPVAFYDDDRAKWNTQIHGVPVLGSPEMLTEAKTRTDEAVIAMPSASGRRVRQVVRLLNEAKIKSEIVPSFEQMMNGTVKVSQIRPVEIEDLLGREKIPLETTLIRALIQDKVVMVTGAGGSIGSELCRQILGHNPLRLLLIERSEVQMFQLEQELIGHGGGSQIVPLVADVLNDDRMQGIFRRFQPQIIFHAAAHKHVPMMEHQPFEAFQNNTIGTKRLALLAAEKGVERFVLISTDKAINPTNTMGATKRLAELFVQALQRESRTKTKFMAVRFGNVLGSSGSVIPTFRKQIAAGGPVTVTHPDVTRYFMTVGEAVGLVLQSATQGEGGEIFVLDMGKPVKIVDVAQQLIELSGLKPEIDMEIKFTGLRPGEKLFEELNHNSENMIPTSHPKIMRFTGVPQPLEVIHQGLLNLYETAGGMDANQVKLEIQKLVPEYKPYLTSI